MCKTGLPRESSARALGEAAIVGKGFCSDVYAWDEGRVLKLFHDRIARAKIEREFRATRAVHAAGLPVPFAYERVEVDGRSGIVFERVDGLTMFAHVQAKPWTMFDAVRQLAELHAQIHRCVSPLELPSQREWIAGNIDAATDLSAAEKELARRRLAHLPDGTALCHGDFHPGNILITSRGPVIIDWDTATRGHALGDVACTTRLIHNAGLPSWAPSYMHMLLACTRPLIHRCYLKRYFQLHAGTRQQIRAWQIPFAAAAAARAWQSPADRMYLKDVRHRVY